MSDTAPPAPPAAPAIPPLPSLEDMQHWTWVMGRAQQMAMEAGLKGMRDAGFMPEIKGFTDN
ncbi:hypothetical protein ABTM77_20925, partial [Acinetobacter baumannii]